MAWGPAAGGTAQVSFVVDKPRSFSLNLTTLVPQVTQLVRILQDPGEALVSRSRLLDKSRSRLLATGEPTQRELQGTSSSGELRG